MDNLKCPFCGSFITLTIHPPHPACGLASYGFTNEQWAMRPPKEDRPTPAMTSEVEYLRGLLEKLVIQEVGLRG